MSVEKCVKYNDAKALQSLIAQGYDINVPVGRISSIRHAISTQKLDVFFVLLNAGVQLDRECISGCLQIACQYREEPWRTLDNDLIMLRAILDHWNDWEESFQFFDVVVSGMLRQTAILIDYGIHVQTIQNMQAITKIHDWRKAVGESSGCLIHIRSTRWLNHDVIDLLAQHVWTFRINNIR